MNPIHLRNGQAVLAWLPKSHGAGRETFVCLVLSVWVTVRKPKLAVGKVQLDHCVALRVVAMKAIPNSSPAFSQWECDGASEAWVLRPESVVGVLGLDHVENSVDKCKITLSSESLEMIEKMQSAKEWWPVFSDEDNKKGKPKAAHYGLFVLRQGRKRKQNAKKNQKAKKTTKKSTKTKKTKLKAEKKKKEDPPIPEIQSNYTRLPKGAALLQQVMRKAKNLDDMKFAGQEVFAKDTGLCKLKVGHCEGVPCEDFISSAHSYFKNLHL